MDTVVGILGGRFDVDRLPPIRSLGKFPRHPATGADGEPLWLHEIGYCGEQPLEELGALCRLRHPSLLATLDAGVTHGRVFVVTECFAESDLLTIAAALPDRRDRAIRSLRALATACDAVAYLHAAGVVHGWFGPQDFLVRAADAPGSDEVRVVAFSGKARSLVLSTLGLEAELPDWWMRGALCWSPDVIRGKLPVPADDLFSLGSVLYAALSGRFPFVGPTDADVALKVLQAPAPVLPGCGLSRRAHAAARALVAQLLAKERSARPAGAALVAEEIRRITVLESAAGEA